MAHHILVCVSDTLQRIALRGAFAASGYEVTVAADPGDIGGDGPAPQAVIASIGPDPSRRVAALRAALPRDPDTAPAIIGFGPADGLARLTAIRAGFDDCIADTALLRARLRDVLRSRDTRFEMRRRLAASRLLGLAEDPSAFRRRPRIALVGDVSDAVEIAAARRADWHVSRCTPASALDGRCRADGYVLSARSDLATLIPELRAQAHSRRAAILCLFADNDAATAARALDARASDAIPLCATGEEVSLRIERALRRKDSEDALRRQTEAGLHYAVTDTLTGLHNRRYAEAYLDEMLQAAQTTRKRYCAMMIDLDRFKQVNDRDGHAAGDDILRMTAAVLRDNLRSMDLVARLGGDEFLVVMPATTPRQAGLAAERLRARFAAAAKARGTGLEVTLSIGIAIRAGAGGRPQTAAELLAAADRALYAAKAGGRNCVRETSAA